MSLFHSLQSWKCKGLSPCFRIRDECWVTLCTAWVTLQVHLFSHPGLDLGHIVTDTPINETAEHGQRLCSDSRQIRLVSQIQYERTLHCYMLKVIESEFCVQKSPSYLKWVSVVATSASVPTCAGCSFPNTKANIDPLSLHLKQSCCQVVEQTVNLSWTAHGLFFVCVVFHTTLMHLTLSGLDISDQSVPTDMHLMEFDLNRISNHLQM